VTPLPMAANRTRITLHTVPSGEIALETGADGLFLLFDCACQDAMPFCHGNCCTLHGLDLSTEEVQAGKYEMIDTDRGPQLKRGADGRCVYQDRYSFACSIWGEKPKLCHDFHCTRGPYMRGWKLTLERLSGSGDE
jgi:hypothetical protein